MFKSDFLSVPFLALELKTMFLWMGTGIVQKIKGLLELKNRASSLEFIQKIAYHNISEYDTRFIIKPLITKN